MSVPATYLKSLRKIDRSWKDASENPYLIRKLIDGYASMVSSRMDKGYKAYIITIMFNQIHTMYHSRIDIMRSETIHVWKVILTNTSRQYNDNQKLPFMMAYPDLPVHKNDKEKLSSLKEVTVNGGKHVGGILCIPPWTCLKDEFSRHLIAKQRHYVGSHGLIRTVHAKPIECTPNVVVDYTLKMLKRREFSTDEIWLFPDEYDGKSSGTPSNIVSNT